ncbi:hypothetical protein U9M48_008149 [Paspalum notatum var. saurae]|uniref:Uncharacterized protein n=1 Tax=Paspalum notatum var. saurae TaxID=547442 RepID=A0AAQ3WCQ2_PASNO
MFSPSPPPAGGARIRPPACRLPRRSLLARGFKALRLRRQQRLLLASSPASSARGSAAASSMGVTPRHRRLPRTWHNRYSTGAFAAAGHGDGALLLRPLGTTPPPPTPAMVASSPPRLRLVLQARHRLSSGSGTTREPLAVVRDGRERG